MPFSQSTFARKGDPREITLAASVCPRDRRIVERYERPYSDFDLYPEDSRDFREFRRMASQNVGVRI